VAGLGKRGTRLKKSRLAAPYIISLSREGRRGRDRCRATTPRKRMTSAGKYKTLLLWRGADPDVGWGRKGKGIFQETGERATVEEKASVKTRWDWRGRYRPSLRPNIR